MLDPRLAAPFVGILVAVIGGAAAGILLRELHIAGHPDRHMGGRRTFIFITMLGFLYYIGQVVGAIALGFPADALVFFFGLWLTFAASAGIAVAVLARARTIAAQAKERGHDEA